MGVLGYQGGIPEHIFMTKKACSELGMDCEVVSVRRPEELNNLDGLIIPGGESTAITKLGSKYGTLDVIKDKVLEGLPTLGTCAGAVILAKYVKDLRTGRELKNVIGVLDVEVVRNFYGRQRESFEVHVKIPVLGDSLFRCVFIRAPAVTKVIPPAESLAKYGNSHIMVQEGCVLATTFHPELTQDTRVHKYFVKMIKR